ncbi:MAG: hypothetical protein AB7O52_00990 [Planctomycetota bacterium]
MVLVVVVVAWDGLHAIEKTRLSLAGKQTVEGRVFDLGGSALDVVLRHGSRQVPKSSVERWQVVDGGETGPVRPVLVLKNGHEVSGDITFDSSRGDYVVKVEVGEARYPAQDVVRLVQPNGICSDGAFSPRRGLQDRLDEAVDKVRKGTPREQSEALEYLAKCGYFALKTLQREVGIEADSRLRRLLASGQVLASVPADVEKSIPDFFAVLTTGLEADRVGILRDAFLLQGEELFPLLGALLLDETQPAAVRSFAVDILQRLQRVPELVQAYQLAQGPAQLAVAIALGDAGIYVGIPTLIEALALDSPGVRELAAAKLEEYTGESFGYRAGDASLARTAVAQWQDWWRLHEPQVTEQLQQLLTPGVRTNARARATALWRQGNEAWDRNESGRAYDLFRSAVDEDATFLQPFLCLGIIDYQQRARFEEGKTWFLRALRRAPLDADRDVMRLLYYHLGRVHKKVLESEEARSAFLRSIAIDPYYADAWYDLGDTIYEDALLAKSPEDRRERFREAAQTFEQGYTRLQEYRNSLVVLTRSNLPVGTDLPFSPREHNRSLKALKDHLVKFEGRLACRVAQAHLALSDLERAVLWATRAAESPWARPDDCLLLALIYDGLGRSAEANRERERAKQVRPPDPQTKE